MSHIQVNSAYEFTSTGNRIRVLAADPNSDQAVIIPLKPTLAKPVISTLSQLRDALMARSLIPVDPTIFAVPEKLIPDHHQTYRNKMMGVIRPLVKAGIQQLIQSDFWQRITTAAKQANLSPNCVYKALTRYFQGGCTESALTPKWSQCGRTHCSKGEKQNDFRPTAQPGAYPLTVNDIANIKRGAELFYKDKASWEEAHENTLEKYYCTHIEVVDGREVRRVLPAGQCPSYWQFFRIGYAHLGTIGRLKAKLGARGFELKGRGKPGSQAADALYPGLVAEIDWTITDSVLVRRNNRLSIGRLVVYAIVDRESGEILSIYLTLSTGRYEEAARAILVCLEDKVDLCAKHGVHITPDKWPAQHLFTVLVSDKGEVDSWKATPIATGLGIELIHTPGKRPDAKGMIEAVMKVINYLLYRRIPGATTGLRQRCIDDPRVEAAYDFDQANTVLHAFVVWWNQRIRKLQPRTKGMVDAGILPVPNHIWKWAEDSGCLRTFDLNAARLHLLPWHEASVTERGFAVKGLRYVVPDINPQSPYGIDANEWLASARQKRWKMQLAIDPATVAYVWFRHAPRGKPPILIQCPLAPGQDGFARLSWEEYRLAEENEKIALKVYKNTSLREAGQEFRAIFRDVTNQATALTAAKRDGMSKAEQTHGVGQNRAAEVAERTAEEQPAPVGPRANFKPFFDDAVWGKDEEIQAEASQ